MDNFCRWTTLKEVEQLLFYGWFYFFCENDFTVQKVSDAEIEENIVCELHICFIVVPSLYLLDIGVF